MENIVRLDDNKMKLLKVNITPEGNIALYSIDGGDEWKEISFDSPIVQENLFRFEQNEKKLEFFKNFVGKKIKLTKGNIKGWLVIKSLENISIIPNDGGDMFSVNYADIEYEELGENVFELRYNLVRKQPIESSEANREKYEQHIKSAMNNHQSINPLSYQRKL